MVAGKENVRGEGTAQRSLETSWTRSPAAPGTLSCWAGAGAALSGLVSPLGRANPATGYFCVRRAWNPGLGRLRGRLGELREGKFGRLGWALARTPDPGPICNPKPTGLRPLRAAPAAACRAPAPRAADAAPEPARPGRPAPPRRAHSPPPPAPGVLGVLGVSGRGCHRRPGGLPRRVPARAPARPSGRPARRECQGARGVRAGGGPAGGGGLTDSGLRNAHGPPGPGRVTSSGKAAELCSPRCRAAGAPVAVAGGGERRSYGDRTWWPS